MAPWLFVCPASRGIGLEVARRLLRTTTLPLVATARRNPDQTRARILEGAADDDDDTAADRLTVLEVDVTEEDTIAAAAAHCAAAFPPGRASSKTSPTHHLHLAVCLPGILHPEKSPAQIDAAAALATFRTNTLGPLLLLKHFARFLPSKGAGTTAGGERQLLPPDSVRGGTERGVLAPHATFAALSARVGSIGDNTGLGGWYSYRASKAGVNQLMRTLDNGLRVQSGGNAIAVALHPGTVKTGLSKDFWGTVPEGKLFSAEFAAERLVEVVAGLGVERGRGRCWDWKGEEVPP